MYGYGDFRMYTISIYLYLSDKESFLHNIFLIDFTRRISIHCQVKGVAWQDDKTVLEFLSLQLILRSLRNVL